MNNLLTDELALTTSQLKQHPKVYGIWNHRRWCLANVPDGPSDDDHNGWRQAYWNKELLVVEKMLEADARNCEPTCNLLREQQRSRTFSPRLELSTLRPGQHARAASCTDRADIHEAEDRSELLELQRVAPTFQGADVPMGGWAARHAQLEGRRLVGCGQMPGLLSRTY